MINNSDGEEEGFNSESISSGGSHFDDHLD